MSFLITLIVVSSVVSYLHASPSLRTTLSTACGHLEVPSGTIITGGDWEYGGDLLATFPNNTQRMVKSCRTEEEMNQLRSLKPTVSDGPPNQWLAWYNANYPVWSTGGTQMSAVFSVPPLPSQLTANLALFPGLQPTYNPTNYDFILQPVLSIGSWMDGGSHAKWDYRAVTCISSAGYCVYATMFDVKPGEVLYGGMNLVNTTNGQNCWVINATSTTTGYGNTISYCTKYMITFAFVALEHNPAGSIDSCSTLPPGSINFTDIEAQPDFNGMWQGTLGDDAACGIDVDTFPSGDLGRIANLRSEAGWPLVSVLARYHQCSVVYHGARRGLPDAK